MKLNDGRNVLSNSNHNIKNLIDEENTREILKQAAEILKRHLLQELQHTTLPEQVRASIINSLEIQNGKDGNILLNIRSGTIKDIEYGTNSQPEQPLILRARQSAQSEINQLIKSIKLSS